MRNASAKAHLVFLENEKQQLKVLFISPILDKFNILPNKF